jgi:hypothetical protein
LWGSGLTWVDLYFFFSFTIQYLDCLIMEFYNFIQFAFINDFFNFLLTQIIVWLNKTFILKNKVIKYNWVYDPCCKIKYFYLSYFLIKYQFIQLNIIYDWKSFCVQKKKGGNTYILFFWHSENYPYGWWATMSIASNTWKVKARWVT